MEMGSYWTTGSGEFQVNPFYSPEDLSALSYDKDIGSPGEYPYTRGYRRDGYRGKLWRMAAYSGFASGEDANERYRSLVKQGATRLSIALDLPTQLGYDSDHPSVFAEVGKIGVAIDSLQDIEDLLEGIPLESIRLGTTANAISPIAIAWFLAMGKKQGLRPERMNCYVQNDILKEFICRGTYIFPLYASMRVTMDVMEYCTKYLPPSWMPAIICGTHMRFAGASPSQEVAFTLSNAMAYLEEARKRGISIQELVSRLEFHMCSGLDIFEEAAKFRALRKVWSRVIRERFGISQAEAQTIHLSAASPAFLFTAQQHLNNITRNTLSVLAAVLGGVEEFLTLCHDEAFAIPTAQAAMTALRTQQIIAHESGVAGVIDPLGGSWYIEDLTRRMEEKVLRLIRQIDDMGGALKAIEKGFYQKQINENAYRYQKEVEESKRTVVGVNRFTIGEDLSKVPIFRVDSQARQRQIAKLQKLRSRRDPEAVAASLAEIEAAAHEGSNLVPPIITAVNAYTTVGEICNALTRVFGRYDEEIEYF
jgi:methylmalonyl-CoA mutase N-terminal domain/subunit